MNWLRYRTKPRHPYRRLSDRIRLLADRAWSQGDKQLGTQLHDLARRKEEKR